MIVRAAMKRLIWLALAVVVVLAFTYYEVKNAERRRHDKQMVFYEYDCTQLCGKGIPMRVEIHTDPKDVKLKHHVCLCFDKVIATHKLD